MIQPSSRLKLIGQQLLREALKLAPLLVLIAACLIPKTGRGHDRERYEFFPFSHFPMYSGFDERDYYVYVTDRNGEPVATESLTFFRSTKLKKIFDTELDRIQKQYKKRKDLLTPEQCRPAGDATLQWLVTNAPESAKPELRRRSPFTLSRVYISVEDGAIVETSPQEIGNWPAKSSNTPNP